MVTLDNGFIVHDLVDDIAAGYGFNAYGGLCGVLFAEVFFEPFYGSGGVLCCDGEGVRRTEDTMPCVG